MKLILVKSDVLDNWWLIERFGHDHKEWLVPLQGGFSYMHSGRICDADVEGHSSEMLAIAEAIKSRGRIWFKRCAVDATGKDTVDFWSPRNSQTKGFCSFEEADALAKQIRQVLSRDAFEHTRKELEP